MTRISVSTPAGSELLAGWVRRALRHPETEGWVLRGSVMMAALCPSARRPADVDYLVLAALDQDRWTKVGREIADLPDEHTELTFEGSEIIWAETEFPGLRFFVSGQLRADRTKADRFQVDLGFDDPLSTPPVPTDVPGVGPVRTCAPETLFAWKVHGLVEFGRGRWRAKDLYDLDVLSREVHLDRDKLLGALALAFSSRSLTLDALDDFRSRDTWGCSGSGTHKWRAFGKKQPGVPPFLEVRERVRRALDELLGPLTAQPQETSSESGSR